MNNTALIFGAGKTGRGFAAHLAFISGYEVILVDKNKQLIEDLKKAGRYNIEVLGNEERNCTINLSGAYTIDDQAWLPAFVSTHLIFTSVFGNNLEAIATNLAAALRKRYIENARQYLTIITCENLTNAAGFLQNMVVKHMSKEEEKWLLQWVGFSEAIIFRTCLDAGAAQSALTVRAQNFFEMPCDGEAVKENLHMNGLKPLTNFRHQLRRKIYTYNCINAVIAYLGAEKGYLQLDEAANDPSIVAIARKAAIETCSAQVAEFGFNPIEQQEWMEAALAKFADRNIPDPVERNAADPARKLGRDDRLIGPALLAMKHHIDPEGLLAGIVASFNYFDRDKKYKLADLIRQKGPDVVLKEICGLSPEEELFRLIKAEIVKSGLHD
ncbi:MAG: hypothetical protein M3040_16290 [Bacteroidota bacterium]|nr:hypothetical protein [Bacteroidota bacterium]